MRGFLISALCAAIIAVAICITALCAQTRTKNNFESAAKQHFQNYSCGSFDRQLL